MQDVCRRPAGGRTKACTHTHDQRPQQQQGCHNMHHYHFALLQQTCHRLARTLHPVTGYKPFHWPACMWFVPVRLPWWHGADKRAHQSHRPGRKLVSEKRETEMRHPHCQRVPLQGGTYHVLGRPATSGPRPVVLAWETRRRCPGNDR